MPALSDMSWISLTIPGSRLLCGGSAMAAPLTAMLRGASLASRHELPSLVSMESHGCIGGQKLEITRPVLVLLVDVQNMNRTYPDQKRSLPH
jgi:hypothetical protein